MVTYTHSSEGSWLIESSANPDKLQISEFDDVQGMQPAPRPLLLGVEVESLVGWDWNNDPLALDT
ncbi:hypothetical protein [Streptomyces sp. NBC_00273]|uniref:hypothetical protein n=1 Tax=Streptomyces sp. NBC_00273 TaxID=2903644 RepID=UPI002E2840FA|nr:hypothetical protein [Streptomyces sp. NBC_00273]